MKMEDAEPNANTTEFLGEYVVIPTPTPFLDTVKLEVEDELIIPDTINAERFEILLINLSTYLRTQYSVTSSM